MSTRRIKGTTPPAFVRDGKPVPPSADVAERTLAEVIGEAVALHQAELLGPLLERIATAQYRPACIVCAVAAKRAERDYEIAVANALAAAEPEPGKPDVTVTESFTIDPVQGPVCWAHYEPGE